MANIGEVKVEMVKRQTEYVKTLKVKFEEYLAGRAAAIADMLKASDDDFRQVLYQNYVDIRSAIEKDYTPYKIGYANECEEIMKDL